jgi:spoIIIJ-associated protein
MEISDTKSRAIEDGGLETDALSPEACAAFEIMEEICAASGLEMRPMARREHPPYLDVELIGSDVEATFGRMGRALDALQYLANLIIGRRVGGEIRVALDACNYRERRAVVLQQLALDCAAQVKARQEECELDPLPPHERRIIHNALADDPEVRTYSEGEEPERRVVIAPR